MLDAPARNREIEGWLEQGHVVTRVCRHIEEFSPGRLPETVQVSYLNRPLERDEEVEDILGERGRFAELRFPTPRGLLLLIDPSPHANWGHPCWVATVDEDDTVRVVENPFPPRESPTFRLAVYDTRYGCRPSA